MNNQYNQYNFEAKDISFEKFLQSFTSFLKSKNLSLVSIKNYLADLRHFLGYVLLKLKSQNIAFNSFSFLEKINSWIVDNYKNFLLVNKIPAKTINRRLSAMRQFFSFCVSQGWMKENPGKGIKNILPPQKTNKTEFFLQKYRIFLESQKMQKNTVKNYINDIKQYLNFCQNPPNRRASLPYEQH